MAVTIIFASCLTPEEKAITVSSHLRLSRAPVHSILLKRSLITSEFYRSNTFHWQFKWKIYILTYIHKVLAGNHIGHPVHLTTVFFWVLLTSNDCADCYWWNIGHSHCRTTFCFYLHRFLTCAAHQRVIVRISCGPGKACNPFTQLLLPKYLAETFYNLIVPIIT